MIRRCLVFALVLVSTQLVAQESPVGESRVLPSEETASLVLPVPDERALRLADEERVDRGKVPHFAAAHEVQVDPWNDGRWDPLSRGRIRWRLRIHSPGALSLSYAFERFSMPEGATFRIHSVDPPRLLATFSGADQEEHGQLWTPPFLGSEHLLELILPFARLDELDLSLARVHHGYAGFGEPEPKAGECHRDMVCSEGEPWGDVARSVALISIEGVRFCTGFLVNNTALDGRPFFLTAHHCDIDAEKAPSVVVMWNHESSVCREGRAFEGEVKGHLRDFQSGAILRASSPSTDIVLLELDDRPKDTASVYFAGWDRSGDPPRRSVSIHHPNTDAKRISFDFDPATPTDHLSEKTRTRGNHWRVADWDVGTTEGGSSGAPLFNRDRQVVGVLHGGYAACGNQKADWFGRLDLAWRSGGLPETRIGSWLDPVGSEVLTLDGLDASSVTNVTAPD